MDLMDRTNIPTCALSKRSHSEGRLYLKSDGGESGSG